MIECTIGPTVAASFRAGMQTEIVAVPFGPDQLLEVEGAVPEYPPGAPWFVAPRLRHGAIIAHGGHIVENRGIGPVRSLLNRQCGALWRPDQGAREGQCGGRLEGRIGRSGGRVQAGWRAGAAAMRARPVGPH